MHLWVGVENFAKIEKAKICVNNYTLLVGPNNSGKTFLMQLVQGLSDKIVNLIDKEILECLLVEEIVGYSKYEINEANIIPFIEHINCKLDVNKDILVKEIFGKEIPIDKLYIETKLNKNITYKIEVLDAEGFKKEKVKEEVAPELLSFARFFDNKSEMAKVAALSKMDKENLPELQMIAFEYTGFEISAMKTVLRRLLEKNSLFMPASRTGLMLLYRDFFANKTDDAILYQMKDAKLVEDKERYGGLTQPIYEFLRFLQTYSNDEEMQKFYREELDFFEERLIEGHISVNKQGTFSYNSKRDNNIVPMYLASAMINEVTPMVLALSSGKAYERLIIDEVEASLHPEKQHELTRFLNRLNNRNMSLLFSTHSDTFVSKLNNLYILSEYVKQTGNKEILGKFGLEKDDLIKTENLFVYEFVIQENGKSIVKEIIPDKRTGYQFDLFTKSAMNLYEEAFRIGEMH